MTIIKKVKMPFLILISEHWGIKLLNRGSEFRKWDLHIHSPYTMINNQFGLSDGKGEIDEDKFIQKIKESNISAVGLTNYFNFTEDEAIAFGDGGNDICMLQAVGTGVAMGNAADNVKAVADEVCGSVDEDGVYYYLKEKGCI